MQKRLNRREFVPKYQMETMRIKAFNQLVSSYVANGAMHCRACERAQHEIKGKSYRDLARIANQSNGLWQGQ